MSFSHCLRVCRSAECSTVFANAVLRGPAESTALQSRCVSSHRPLQPTFCLWYPDLATLGSGRRERVWLFGCVFAHPPACTDGTAPAYDGLFVTKSDPFEQYMK
jgi:hypothetical protein